jgi:drug/metabolite transporter (DMT)-like permease
MLISTIYFREKIKSLELAGIAFIVAGILILVLSRP